MVPLPGLVALGGLLTLLLILLRTRPRHFYLVRHGETVLNAAHVRQGEAGSLSEEGRDQAKKVGAYLKQFTIREIISSTYERARETAELINTELHVPIAYSKLFIERRNPSEIIGKSRDMLEVKNIVDQIENAYHADDYRYSDEENFIELKERARKILTLLARQRSGDTVIVTHHVILKMLLAYILYREKLHAGDFVKLSFLNISDNATITVCEYHPLLAFTRSRGWSVASYNEQPD
ncbi:MAG: histidine phosphatase family protein [Candidatus Paceibacterota bacterium]